MSARIRLGGIFAGVLSESGFAGFGMRAFASVLAGFSVMAKSASLAKRNPENPANPVNPDSDKAAMPPFFAENRHFAIPKTGNLVGERRIMPPFF